MILRDKSGRILKAGQLVHVAAPTPDDPWPAAFQGTVHSHQTEHGSRIGIQDPDGSVYYVDADRLEILE